MIFIIRVHDHKSRAFEPKLGPFHLKKYPCFKKCQKSAFWVFFHPRVRCNCWAARARKSILKPEWEETNCRYPPFCVHGRPWWLKTAFKVKLTSQRRRAIGSDDNSSTNVGRKGSMAMFLRLLKPVVNLGSSDFLFIFSFECYLKPLSYCFLPQSDLLK